MKLEGLLRHLRRHRCVLRREGKEHALWENPQTSHAEAVPHYREGLKTAGSDGMIHHSLAIADGQNATGSGEPSYYRPGPTR